MKKNNENILKILNFNYFLFYRTLYWVDIFGKWQKKNIRSSQT